VTPPSEWSPAERFVSGPGPQAAAPLEAGCRCRSLFLAGDERTNAGALHEEFHAIPRPSEQTPKAERQRSTWGAKSRAFQRPANVGAARLRSRPSLSDEVAARPRF
jgi:hypothetical protein